MMGWPCSLRRTKMHLFNDLIHWVDQISLQKYIPIQTTSHKMENKNQSFVFFHFFPVLDNREEVI